MQPLSNCHLTQAWQTESVGTSGPNPLAIPTAFRSSTAQVPWLQQGCHSYVVLSVADPMVDTKEEGGEQGRRREDFTYPMCVD